MILKINKDDSVDLLNLGQCRVVKLNRKANILYIDEVHYNFKEKHLAHIEEVLDKWYRSSQSSSSSS